MSEWLWVVAVGVAFGAGVWWGERLTIAKVARMLVVGILRWGPNVPPRELNVRERSL